jgi:hypothetical protein
MTLGGPRLAPSEQAISGLYWSRMPLIDSRSYVAQHAERVAAAAHPWIGSPTCKNLSPEWCFSHCW